MDFIIDNGWREQMKKKVLISIVTVVFAGVVAVAAVQWKKAHDRKEQQTSSVSGDDCKVEEVVHEAKKIYSDEYQAETDSQLADWKEDDSYSVESPLLVWNPYGTNTGSCYYYAQTTTDSYVVCEVTPQRGSVIKNRLKNDSAGGLTKEHEYLITGLATGQKNQITLSFYDGSDQLIQEKSYSVTLKEDAEIPAITKVEKGESKA